MFNLLDHAFFMGGLGTAPRLEILERHPGGASERTPLLFVHGAYAGAWCWDEFFLPYFAKRGFSAHALSLRGHGGSGGMHLLQTASLGDYVRDLERAVAGFDRPPVLIGHSMGGMVIQKYLERVPDAPTVLMASVPPQGLAQASLRLMMGEPWLLTQLSLLQALPPALVDLQTARKAIFSDDIPEAQLLRYIHRFQPESQRAIWDMTVANLPRRWRGESPRMLVLGAERDMLFSPDMVRETAASYRLDAEIFPNMAHAMMLERDWQAVAERIIDWLDEQAL